MLLVKDEVAAAALGVATMTLGASTVLRGSARDLSFIEEELPAGMDELREVLTETRTGLKRVAAAIGDLTAFSRGGTDESGVDLNAIVGEADGVRGRVEESVHSVLHPQAGTGLGQATSREYLRRAGGDLLVSHRPGGGARFTLTLCVA